MATNVVEVYRDKAEIIQFPAAPRIHAHRPTGRKQTMEAIESEADINRIVTCCLEAGRFRDAMLFVFGFNSGLRISDIILTDMFDVLGGSGATNISCRIVEKKTAHPATIYINEAVKEMLEIYLDKTDVVTPVSYLFESYGRGVPLVEKDGYMVRPHLSRQTAWKIIKHTTMELGLDGKFGTHTLRKTPVWKLITTPQDEANTIIKNPAGLQAAQALLHHGSAQSTLHYVGALEKQLKIYYMSLNLGLKAIQEYKSSH